jgi:transposase
MMLPAKMPIYCATTPVDLRRSFDGLAASANEVLGKDPRSGALFLFVNKAGNRLKALWWDRTAYCLLDKRLERGVFSLTERDAARRHERVDRGDGVCDPASVREVPSFPLSSVGVEAPLGADG